MLPLSLPLAVALGFAVDLIVGDPPWLYKRLWHPVVPIGKLAAFCERRCNRLQQPRQLRILVGGLVWLAIVGGCALLGWQLAVLFSGWGMLGVVLTAVLGSSLLAFRSLSDHVAAVARALEQAGLTAGQQAVAQIVGRRTELLDSAGVSRAAVESLAENFSDGVIAPLFWWLLLGLPGLMAYKAINTLDSMLGHRSDRLEAFGKVSARADDLANWLPARLTALLIWAASGFGPALRIARRDAGHHRSPNAGWPEGALAGALTIRLAGPRVYADGPVDEPFIGEGSAELGPADIRRALRLYWRCGALLLAGLLLAGLVA